MSMPHAGDDERSTRSPHEDPLDAIDTAAVAMLETLLVERDAAAATGFDDFARHAGALANDARATSLDGLGYVAELVGSVLAGDAAVGEPPSTDRVAQWTSGLIAFCGGQLDAASRRAWIEDLRDWPALGARLTDKVLARLDERLAVDHDRLARWRLSDSTAGDVDAADASPDGPRPDLGPDVADDELALLAEACAELDRSQQAFVGGETDDDGGGRADGPVAGGRSDEVAADGRIDAFVDRLDDLRHAVDVLGLDRVAALFDVTTAAIRAEADGPASMSAARRRALLAWPGAWRSAFAHPGGEAIDTALALHRDCGWGDDATIDAAQRQWRTIRPVASRRIGVHRPLAADEPMSLAIADDTDPQVIAQLLRELPALAESFSASVERLCGGDASMSEPARRAAHTLKGAATTAGIGGIARFTHALEDLLLLVESTGVDRAPDLDDVLAESADVLAGMVDAVVGRAEPPAEMADAYRRLLDALHRLADRAPAPVGDAATVASDGEADAADAGAAEEGAWLAVAGETRAGESGAGAAGAGATERGAQRGDPDAELRVAESVIDRLVDASTEAAIAVAGIHERLEELERIRRAMRTSAQRASDLALEAGRLVEALRGTASVDAPSPPGDGFDTLEFTRHGEFDRLSNRIAEVGADGRLLESSLGEQVDALAELAGRLDRAQAEARETALGARMVPVDAIVPRLARAARQASRIAGKEVDLRVEGRGERFEARLLQALVEPLGHLIRNAVDHGIEDPVERTRHAKPRCGRIDVRFERVAGGHLRVSCEDDGRGLDIDRVRARAARLGIDAADWNDPAEIARILCAPDFSTRERATQLSGRGLGLGLVAEVVAAHRGRLETGAGAAGGFRVVASLPLELASVGVLMVRTARVSLALMVSAIESIVPIAPGGNGTVVLNERGELRLVRLDEGLGLAPGTIDGDADPAREPDVALVLTTVGGETVAMRIPAPGAARQVIVHPLPVFMPAIAGLEGATVLGDGTVAPVIDLAQSLSGDAPSPRAGVGGLERQRPRCLVVDDSVSVRQAMASLASDLGLLVDTAADGIDALAAIDRNPPAIALIDLEMPRMNGYELARAMRERPETQSIPIIMLTSRASAKHRAAAVAAGVSHFLPKPFVEDDLSRLVLEALGER